MSPVFFDVNSQAMSKRAELPVEVWTEIISSVSATKADPREPTLLSCSQVNSVVRNATLATVVWQLPYQMRYTHSEGERERTRRKTLKQDWRLMYLERRRLDREALVLLDKIREERIDRHERLGVLVSDYACDVWDALKAESELPVPFWVQKGRTAEPYPAESLPRRYWAKTIMGLIARREAVRIWAQCLDPETSNSVSFETAVATFSAFLGVSVNEVYHQMDEVYASCKERLISRGVTLDASAEDFDIWDVSLQLREVVHELGYACSTVPEQGHSDISEFFPHLFLQFPDSNMDPIAPLYIFVSIANRLGIHASPALSFALNYIVIKHRDVSEPPKVIDIFHPGFCDPDEAQLRVACNTAELLDHIAFHRMNSVNSSRAIRKWSVELWQSALYARSCWRAVQDGSFETSMFTSALAPMDRQTVLLDVVSRRWAAGKQRLFQIVCESALQKEEKSARTKMLRSMHPDVLYTVGTIFQHRCNPEVVGCILDWNSGYYELMHAQTSHSFGFEDNDEECDLSQPFYLTLATDSIIRYTAQENITLINPSESTLQLLYQSSSLFSRYFVDFEAAGDAGFGRLILSKEIRDAFPEDV